MTKQEQQQILDLLARCATPETSVDDDYSKGFASGWGGAIQAVRAYLEGAELIPASESSR